MHYLCKLEQSSFHVFFMSQGYYSSSCCSGSDDSDDAAASASASAELKLYRAFIFSAPIFFTFILLFLFYVFYLRPRRVNLSSPMMPTPLNLPHHIINSSTCDTGLKKELREMLPIVVYKESFFVKDTQCSVCLLDYQPEDRLQQIPVCGHTFHMSCIDLWLASHNTCPLCRLSLLTPSAKSSTEASNTESNEDTEVMEQTESRSTRHPETTVIQNVSGEVPIATHCIDVEGENGQSNQ